MAYKGKRSKLVGPWRYCSRCVHKTKIAEMTWQRSLLLCPDCVDYGNDGVPLIGQREQNIATAFEVPTMELQPEPKLTDTNEISASISDELVW